MWSHSANGPWDPWPPRGQYESVPGRQTPYGGLTSIQQTFFLTVQKEGFRQPLPKAVHLHPLKIARYNFAMEETPESLRSRMEAEGKVWYEGAWVDPTLEGLETWEGEVLPIAEATRRRNEAAGMVEFEGEWLTPEERDQRHGERMAAEGRVPFQGRWVTPEQAALEQSIIAEASALSTDPRRQDLEAPRVLGRIEHPLAQVQLFNNCGATTRFLLSGPSSRTIELQPYQTWGLSTEEAWYLIPGRYIVAAIPEETLDGLVAPESAATRSSRSGGSTELRPASQESPLVAGFRYSYTYTGREGALLQNLQDYESPEVILPFEPRPIEVPEVERPAPPQEQPRGGPRRGRSGS